MLKLKQYYGSIEISKFTVQKPPITSPIYHCINRTVPNICRAQVDTLLKNVGIFSLHNWQNIIIDNTTIRLLAGFRTLVAFQDHPS